MKNLILLLILVTSFSGAILSQSCLPEGAHFYHQGMIDDFYLDYPNCKEIEGDVIIGSNSSNITSLWGLQNITSFGGDLTIVTNNYLHYLDGLEDLEEIGGDLCIVDNDALYDLLDLEELVHIGGDLKIVNDSALTSIGGMYNSLITVDGDILISGNPVLVNISRLRNIDASSLNDLSIYHNISLSDCAIESICTYLSAPTGAINIYQNAAGCNNPPEIAAACGITLPCLPFGNYYFFVQNEIDNFQMDYPDCNIIEGELTIIGDSSITNLNGLNGITTINGDLIIYDNFVLPNLQGLNSLQTISGSLQVGKYISVEMGPSSEHGNPSLNNLEGLNSLVSVGGSVDIRYNDTLENLAGLNNLSLIGDALRIDGNNSIDELTGLEALEEVGGWLEFYENEKLTSMTGLENLISIGGALIIHGNNSLNSLNGLYSLSSVGIGIDLYNNPRLVSLTGLSSLNSIGEPGSIQIGYNDSLVSLSGLDNIEAGSISSLGLYENPLLSSCSVQSICDYLSSPNGSIAIYGNDTGCNNAPEIAHGCGFSFSCLPYGDYYFVEQSEIDSFEVNYADCSELTGNIYIWGENITNLHGLRAINSIDGEFYIYNNNSLSSLVGLDSLTSFTGSFYIVGNDALTNLEGLNNLITLEGYLFIGDDYNGGNNALTSLNGLNSLETVRHLFIMNNESLITLEGIENIDPNSIWSVSILKNSSLSYCEVESLCNYLSDDGNIYAANNASGCNSEDEILIACGLGMNENNTLESNINIYPNPSSTHITIETSATTPKFQISIFNLNGQEVISQQISESRTVLNISQLPPGLYFVKLTSDDSVQVMKLVKE